MTLANMHAYVGATGVGLVAGSNLGAVYDSNGQRLGTTASQAAVWNSTGFKTMPLTVDAGKSLTIVGGPGVFVWACLLASGSTVPGFARWAQGVPGFANGLLTAAQAAVGRLAAVVSGSGPPASFTPSTAITLADTPHWVGFS
jgi:hypothetical protein